MKRDVEAAEGRIRSHIRLTPIESSNRLSELTGARVRLKLENLQITGSFKLRGAMNKILSLSAEERARGVVAASSGNHGAAVSYGLRALGCRGIVFVPANASPAKVKNIHSYGAEVRTHATDSGITEVFARRYAEEHGLAYISPYNDPVVVAGQGTLGLELARAIDRIDAPGAPWPRGGPVDEAGVPRPLTEPRNQERDQDFQSSVEDAKASGLVARAIEKTGARGVSVAAPAK